MNLIKSISIIISLATLTLVVVHVESAVCPGQDSCQHNYGKRFKEKYQAQATFLAYTTVQAQTSSYDPIPCCINCSKQPGCDYYYLEFGTGNCTLFSLPDNNNFVMALLGGQLYENIKFEGSCIGFQNNYIFHNMPDMPMGSW
jgi:hypothetical protein